LHRSNLLRREAGGACSKADRRETGAGADQHAYGQQQEGSKIVTRSKYVEIRPDKPDTPEKAKWPEFKTCKYTTEAIVSDGIDKGELRKVCTQADCPVHHPKKQPTKADASFKAEQDKRRKEEALANATGMRVLQTIAAAVPVRLMKRDLLFIAEQMLPLLDDKRQEMVARSRGIKAKEGESAPKLLTAFVRKADESALGKLIVETVILLSARTQSDGGKVLRAAAQVYKVDTDAIALKVKQEFAAKEKGEVPEEDRAKARSESPQENGIATHPRNGSASGQAHFLQARLPTLKVALASARASCSAHPTGLRFAAAARVAQPTPKKNPINQPTAADQRSVMRPSLAGKAVCGANVCPSQQA
jgi:hypothetical protein